MHLRRGTPRIPFDPRWCAASGEWPPGGLRFCRLGQSEGEQCHGHAAGGRWAAHDGLHAGRLRGGRGLGARCGFFTGRGGMLGERQPGAFTAFPVAAEAEHIRRVSCRAQWARPEELSRCTGNRMRGVARGARATVGVRQMQLGAAVHGVFDEPLLGVAREAKVCRRSVRRDAQQGHTARRCVGVVAGLAYDGARARRIGPERQCRYRRPHLAGDRQHDRVQRGPRGDCGGVAGPGVGRVTRQTHRVRTGGPNGWRRGPEVACGVVAVRAMTPQTQTLRGLRLIGPRLLAGRGSCPLVAITAGPGWHDAHRASGLPAQQWIGLAVVLVNIVTRAARHGAGAVRFVGGRRGSARLRSQMAAPPRGHSSD